MIERDPRRRFTRAEKSEMYARQGGLCFFCHTPLNSDMEGDHYIAHSRGGRTDLANGVAACPACNQAKGSQAMEEKSLRPKQDELMRVCVDRITDRHGQTVAAQLAPGYGKELGSLVSFNAMCAATGEDLIGLHLAPRVSLTQQIERKFATDYRADFDLKHISDVRMITKNGGRLLVPDANFYTASFSLATTAMRSRASMYSWREFAQETRSRLVLIVDEAQLVGHDPDGDDGTLIADFLEDVLRPSAALILVLTGTPTREDGAEIWACQHLYATATDADARGNTVREFHPDVKGTYREGVEAGFLLPLTAVLVDATNERTDIATGETWVNSTETDESVMPYVRNENVRRAVLTAFVQELRNQRKVSDPRVGGFVWGHTKKDLLEIEKLLRSIDPTITTCRVDTDIPESKAAELLEQASKPGSADVLITVRKASIGYDAPHRSLGADLSPDRGRASHEQRLLRTARVWLPRDGGPELKKQRAYIFGVNDPASRDLYRRLREDSDAAEILREQRESSDTREETSRREFDDNVTVEGAAINGLRAFGESQDDAVDRAHRIHEKHPMLAHDDVLFILQENDRLTDDQPEPGTGHEPYSKYSERMSKAQESVIKKTLLPLMGIRWLGASDEIEKARYSESKRRVTGKINEATRSLAQEGTRQWWVERERVIAAMVEAQR